MAAGFQGLRADVTTLLHRTSPLLQSARCVNSDAAASAAPLTPVPHPDTGAMPPAAMFYPATAGQLRELTSPRVNALLAFYGLAQVDTLQARRDRLATCLGCRWGGL